MISAILTDFMVFPSISLKPKTPIVGQKQAIVCTATVLSTAEQSAVFTWGTPDGVDINDKRVTILPTTVRGSNHTSVLQFKYLMESDVGTYKCDIISNNSTTSVFGELQDLYSK